MNANITVEGAASQFLTWLKVYRKARTHKWYSEHLANFLPYIANLTVSEVRAYHLSDFVSVQTWSQSYKAGSIATMKRWGKWIVEREMLSSNPFSSVKKPVIQPRNNVPTADDITEFSNAHIDQLSKF